MSAPPGAATTGRVWLVFSVGGNVTGPEFFSCALPSTNQPLDMIKRMNSTLASVSDDCRILGAADSNVAPTRINKRMNDPTKIGMWPCADKKMREMLRMYATSPTITAIGSSSGTRNRST